jgi:hypothetical protein
MQAAAWYSSAVTTVGAMNSDLEIDAFRLLATLTRHGFNL